MVNSKVWLVVASMMLSLFGCDLSEDVLVPEWEDSYVDVVAPEQSDSDLDLELDSDLDSDLDLDLELDLELEAELEADEDIYVEEVPEEELPKKLIAIDAGHQGKGNSSQEPNGPGSSTMKAKVSSGTTGRFTGIPEYILTLDVALMLEEALLEMGYDVLMIRSTHDVDISNSERAIMANEAGADAFIRIHANGDNSASVEGAFTICMTPSNPYNAFIYSESRLLSELVLESFIAHTGAKERSIWETDTMTGTNWCTVPTTIIEMGFMTNEKEDRLMATQEYREKMVAGMAEGLDRFIKATNP